VVFLPAPVGPLGAWLTGALHGEHSLPSPPRPSVDEALTDHDLQLTLWCLYELHYHGFDDVPEGAEWDPLLLGFRRDLEAPFEEALRAACAPLLRSPDPTRIVEQLTALIDGADSSSVVSHLHREADESQFRDYLRRRSLYHLKESDPQSFVLPRIGGGAKTALAEIQYDEYGAGRPERLHQGLFAAAMRAMGLDATYGRYLAEADPLTLASNNAMSLFALHRRLRGASLGHLGAFEATSSVPCRRILSGIRRLGLPEEVADYYDEHVEADAAHEQVALRGVCGRLVADEPDLAADVLFGAAACLVLDRLSGEWMLERWGTTRQGAVA
jgi:hypothetical protein